MTKKNGCTIGIIVVILAVLIAAIYGGIYLTRNVGKTDREITTEDALSQLAKYVDVIDPKEGTAVKSSVEYTEDEDAADELPDIDTCEVVVEPTTELYAEIYSSPEKAGDGTDGWLTEMAEAFNAAKYEVDGQAVSIKLRQVNSGQAVDYIATGAAVPDGFTPSSMMWVSMLNADGVATETITDSMIGNVAGIVLENDVYDEFKATYGTVDLDAIVQATAEGNFAMGYTNPFASTTGMNFLISTLLRYDSDNPLSDTAVEGFLEFQSNVPFVSLTTMQMRTAAEKGTLDGFVMEYQTYINDATLSRNYTFTAFGYRHDNPLVAISSTSDEKKEILELFSDFCASNGTDLALEYGFNQMDSYVCEAQAVSGDVLLSAQQLYKENKNTGNSVVAVFVADTSGSMAREPLNSLQESLINAMQYIDTDNYIGLVSYADDVTINVPIAKFDLTQQSLFKGGVESLTATGGTATYDAICVALSIIEDFLETDPDAIPLVFVLSDGMANSGYSYNKVTDIITGLDIPIYTIAYGESADSDALQMISDLNEAACLDASSQDIVYQLKELFNAMA